MILSNVGCRLRFVSALVMASALLSGCGGGDDSGTVAQEPATTAPPPAVGNAAPKITGTAANTATVGKPYAFQPTATDPDKDLITFTIANKPVWASFDATHGKLSGTPTAKDAGGYANIEIAATDGKSVTPLPKFTLMVRTSATTEAVSIAWTPPTDNLDGTPLVNLSGYRIHYGTESQNYSDSVDISNAGMTRYVLDSLPPGKYYFALTALSGAGSESPFSEEVIAMLN